jgi:hypothetical protein
VLLLHGHPRTSTTWHGIDAGHHVAELAPAELADAITGFLRRSAI